MYSIDMSGELPMCRRAENAQVRDTIISEGKLLWQFTVVAKSDPVAPVGSGPFEPIVYTSSTFVCSQKDR